MKRFRNSFFYISIIGVFSALMYWIIVHGNKLQSGRNIILRESDESQWKSFIDSIVHNSEHPLAILLFQIIAIIIVARIFSWICKKIGQPSVVGEIIAGITLGPSLMGMYFPELSLMIFPVKSLGNLQFLSQIGLILFMFVIGMELDLKVLRNKAHEAVVISHASIIVPFALGMGLAYFIYDLFAPEGVPFASFALFLGIAMSITAFPVLARIIQERGINKTRLGTIVITCAAADDITAWCLLAAVIAIVKAGSFISSVYVIISAIIYVLFMLKIVHPFLKRVGDLHSSRENMSKPIVGIFFLTLILSAFLTELIGIHALFGAFMAGAIMPANIKFRNIFIEKVEDVALVLLLPIFFVFTGLRTEIGLLNEPYLWEITGLIILVAVIGKFAGSAFAAKFVGQSWKDSLTIGALMNTRGLMELVVLNIGYDLGILTPEIFAILVIMALVTTFMTGPALDLINRLYKSRSIDIPSGIKNLSKYKILLSFANPEGGKSLLRFANGLVRLNTSNAIITALHLSPADESHSFNSSQHEEESFEPLIREANFLNQKIQTLYKESNDTNSDILEIANKGDYDLLLIGVGQSIFEGSLLGNILGYTSRIINPDRIINQVKGKSGLFENSGFDDRTPVILNKCEIPVGVLVDKGFTKLDTVILPVFSEKDIFLLEYARKLITNSGAQITVIDITAQVNLNFGLKESIRGIEQIAPNHIQILTVSNILPELFSQKDFMLISIEGWRHLVESKSIFLSFIPSTLILSEKG